MCQKHTEQKNTINRFHTLLERFCYVNGQQQSCTAVSNTYKNKKIGVDLAIEDNYNYIFSVKSGISSGKTFEELLIQNMRKITELKPRVGKY